jgi:hypothetical protein
MILNKNLICVFYLFTCINIIYGSGLGYSCFDGSKSEDCSCSTGTSGTIGTCNCATKTPINVRQGQQCAYDSVNGVDSVGYNIFIKLIKRPTFQSLVELNPSMNSSIYSNNQ